MALIKPKLERDVIEEMLYLKGSTCYRFEDQSSYNLSPMQGSVLCKLSIARLYMPFYQPE